MHFTVTPTRTFNWRVIAVLISSSLWLPGSIFVTLIGLTCAVAPRLDWLNIGENRRMAPLLADWGAALVSVLVTAKRVPTPYLSSQMYLKGIQ